MEITVAKPIEEFIQRQLDRGYADAGEVARQALLRWMDEEEFDSDLPGLASKMAQAREGEFRPHNPTSRDALVDSLRETCR
jgi:Arc/MetJ-type ribon-helix-helix transcriptional regulator